MNETGGYESSADSFAGANVARRVLTLACVALGVACVVLVALFIGLSVPAGSAAQYAGKYLPESDVSAYIQQYRHANDLDDDAKFSEYLGDNGESVAQFRCGIIDQMVLTRLVLARADELGLMPNDSAVDDQMQSAKESFAFGDDHTWSETLDSFGMTEADLREQHRANLAERAVCDADVMRVDPGDDVVREYAQNYLAGTTQKHAYRIAFSGDDAAERAKACYDELVKLQEGGKLNVRRFSKVAREKSDDADVSETGGRYAWSSSAMTERERAVMEDLDEGKMSFVEDLDSSGSVGILFCDETFTFPAASEFKSLELEDIPADLLNDLKESAAERLWEEDARAYLNKMLAKARITYYAVPEGAEYDVDIS